MFNNLGEACAIARATTGKEAANKLFKYFEFHISDKHIFGALLLWQDLFATATTHHQGVAHCLWKRQGNNAGYGKVQK